jgi:hypothetical protein
MRHKEMLRSLTDFGDKVQTGTEALFFYAGHGMQVRGKNYLLPIDAEIRNEASASSEAVDVDQLLDKLALARLSVIKGTRKVKPNPAVAPVRFAHWTLRTFGDSPRFPASRQRRLIAGQTTVRHFHCCSIDFGHGTSDNCPASAFDPRAELCRFNPRR